MTRETNSKHHRQIRLDRAQQKGHRPKARRPLGIESLESRVVLANDLFIVPGVAGETYRLVFDWVSREAAYKNEIGVYQVDDVNGRVDGINPGAAGYSDAVARRALSIFKDCNKPGDTSEITVNAGQRLGLFLIQNGKTGAWQQTNSSNRAGNGPIAFFSFDAANPDQFDHVRASTFANNSQTFSFEDQLGGGDQDYNDAIIRVNLGRKDPLRTPGTTSQNVATTFQLESRKDQPRGEVGVLVADDPTGRIGSLLPGQDGYVAAALAKRQTLFTPAQNAPATQTLTLPSASNLIYYLIDRGSAADFLQQNPTNKAGNGPIALFSIFSASPDGQDHARFLGNNRIGFENSLDCNERDFNDVVLTFSYGTPVSTNVPPTVAARLINDTAGSNGTTTDRITSDPSIELTVTDNSNISRVLVGIDSLPESSFVDVTSRRGTDGKITLDRAFVGALPGGSNLINQLTQGPHTVRVVATDDANLTTRFNFDFNFDSEINPPTATLDTAFDSGTLGDRITNFQAVTLRGTAEVGSLVQFVGGTAQATADSAGIYVLNNVPLAAGANALVIRSTDRAGNTATVNLEITRDSARPSINLQLASDTAGSTGTATDRITSNPTVNGTITDNRGITDLRAAIDPTNNSTLTDVLSSLLPNGTITFTQALLNQLAGGTLSQGPHTLSVFARDAAANFDRVDFTFTFDSATAAPTIRIDPNFDTGAKGDLATAITPIVLTGTAEPGALVSLVGTARTTTASTGGTYSFDNISLVVGDNSFTVQVTDLAGNSAQTTVNITGLPALGDIILPSLTASLATDTAGSTGNNTDRITSNVTVNVQASDNTGVVSLLAGLDNTPLNQYLQLVTQLSGGALVITPTIMNQLAGGTLSQGPHTLRLIAADGADNSRSLDLPFTFDSTTPAPTGALAPASNTGTQNDLITSAATVTIVGTAEPAATVNILGTALSALADSSGNYSIANVALNVGANPFTLRSTDIAGNIAEASLSIVRDVTAPNASVQLQNDTAGPNGTNVDGLTSDPTVSGSFTDNTSVASVRVGLDAIAVDQYLEISSQLSPSGTLSVTPTILNQLAGGTLAQGPHIVRFIVTDAAGNQTSTELGLVFDNVVDNPNLSLDRASDSGVVGDNITNAATITINGTANPNTQVRLIQTGETRDVGSDGTFTFTGVPVSLDNDGKNPLIVEVRDRAGNLSSRGLEIIRRNAAPTLVTAIADISRGPGPGSTPTRIAVDLADNFFDNDINNSLVRFNTNEGNFDMELFDAQAGRTVANFLNYVERGAYNNTFFHRRPTPTFVLQGGGYRLDGTAPSASVGVVSADPPVPNQFGISNTAGTVAMAKLGTDPNSATNQFFVNLVNNTSLDTNNGGFSVFGRIVPETQTTINNLAAIPTANRGTPFNDLPLRNFPANGTANNLAPANLAFVNSVSVVRQVEKLTYTAVIESTTNVNLLTVSTDNRLTISLNPGQTGTATIRVTATDRAGASVSDTFTVTIS
jgi:cyclophilin family peptidyl-prolyl cis-trans isomerase